MIVETIISKKSLNCREAVTLNNLLNKDTDIETSILICKDDRNCNAKSLIGLLSLKIFEGDHLKISINGGNERLAMYIVKDFLTNKNKD